MSDYQNCEAHELRPLILSVEHENEVLRRKLAEATHQLATLRVQGEQNIELAALVARLRKDGAEAAALRAEVQALREALAGFSAKASHRAHTLARLNREADADGSGHCRAGMIADHIDRIALLESCLRALLADVKCTALVGRSVDAARAALGGAR